MSPDIEELKARIVAALDVVDFLDLVGYDLPDLLNIPEIEELIEENKPQLERACR
jgi:hypothetical protein